MTPSCRCEHVGKSDRLLFAVPGSRVGNKVHCGRVLPNEPKDYEGIAPVCKHRRTHDRVLATTLRVCRAEELLRLSIGNLDAPPSAVPLNDLSWRRLNVGVEENNIRVVSARIMTEDYGYLLDPGAMIPQSRKLMDHEPDFCSVAKSLDFGPLQVRVLKHRSRGRQSMTFLPRPAYWTNRRRLDGSEQSRVLSHPSGDMDIFGASFKDRLATVGKVGYDSQVFPFSEPRMRQVDKLQTDPGLGLVRQTLGLNLCFWRPPNAGGIRETKDSITDLGYPDRQTNDNETHTITFLFGQLRGRTIMLPTGATNLLAAVLVQRVVNHRKDLNSRGNQRIHQHSEETTRNRLGAPAPLPQKSIDSGKVPELMESHGQNNLAYRVCSHREDPTDQQRGENTIARSAEAHIQRNIVNLKRIWYTLFQLGVPPFTSLC